MEKFKITLYSLIGVALVLGIGWIALPSDTVNKIARKQIEFQNGDYNVTFSQDTIVKIYKIRGGKVTSTDKGYYFFWVENAQGKSKYRQVPIDKTIIEEI